MAIVIKGGRLIDGTGKPPVESAVVVIDEKRIQAVGPADKVQSPAGATVIAADGRTILPGLMDLHAGIAGLTHAEEPYGMTAKNIAASILRGVANARRCLNVGVTTVRVDTCAHHGVFALKEAFAAGVVDGPRLIVPGRGTMCSGSRRPMRRPCTV